MKHVKLIPLASLLAISSVATPLCLTSCSRETFYEFDLTNEKNVPSVTAFKSDEALDRVKATELYAKAVKEKPYAFLADYIAGQYAFASSLIESEGVKIKEFSIASTLPKIGNTTVYYPQMIDYTYPTASFRVKYHLVAVLKQSGWGVSTNIQLNLDFDAQYKDLPFVAYTKLPTMGDDGIEGSWHIGFMDPADTNIGEGRPAPYTYKFVHEPWSIKTDYTYSYDGVLTDQNTGRNVNLSNTYRYANVIDTSAELNGALNMAYDAMKGQMNQPYTSAADDYTDELDAIGQFLLSLAVSFDFHSTAMGGGSSGGGGEDPIISSLEVILDRPKVTIESGTVDPDANYNLKIYGVDFNQYDHNTYGEVTDLSFVEDRLKLSYEISFPFSYLGADYELTITGSDKLLVEFVQTINGWAMQVDFGLVQAIDTAYVDWCVSHSVTPGEAKSINVIKTSLLAWQEKQRTDGEDPTILKLDSTYDINVSTTKQGSNMTQIVPNITEVKFDITEFANAWESKYSK